MKGDIRCIEGSLYRHDPQPDDPDLETNVGSCPECEGEGCDATSLARQALPCPFCGERLVVKDDHHGEWVGHKFDTSDCIMSVDQIHAVSDLVRWNRRAPGFEPASPKKDIAS